MFCFEITLLFWFEHTRSVCTPYDHNEQYSLVVFGCGCVSFPESLVGRADERYLGVQVNGGLLLADGGARNLSREGRV